MRYSFIYCMSAWRSHNNLLVERLKRVCVTAVMVQYRSRIFCLVNRCIPYIKGLLK